MKLVINTYDIDLLSDDDLKYSIQANTLSDLVTRQTNFTPSFKLAMTPKNVKAMERLYLVGNDSNVPYQKNEAFLYDDSGEPIIEFGWAIIKESKGHYKCYVYDGNIDFYKAIENKTLTDIGLEELNHLKNIDTVIGTWTDLTLPYRYNIADYNGNPVYDFTKINIDYLIPSANVKYLWDKIFEFIGWTYEGSAFDLEDFKNLWLTYPKTISSENQVTVPITIFNWDDNIVYGDVLNFNEHNSLIACVNCAQLNSPYAVGSQQIINILGSDVNMYNNEITAVQSGLFKFTISGTIANNTGTSTTIELHQGGGSSLSIETINEINFGEPFNIVYYKNLEAGESFRLQLGNIGYNGAYGDVDVQLDFVTGNTVDFEEAFISFSITDFVREILVRLGLTPFTDIRNKNVEFLTLEEIVQNEEVDDWSEKYQGKINESYVYGSYGRRNKFGYKYNDDDASFNDGYLNIDNVNLRDEVTAFQSKIYSPDKIKRTILNRKYSVYRFWDKEVNDEGNVEYKPLENRFYFMKSKVIEYSIGIGSDEYQTDQLAPLFAVEDFTQLNWTSILNTFYPAINAIVNKSKINKMLFNFSVFDIKSMDFRKLVYLAQEGHYFLKNKISNWKPKDPNTNTELIRLNLSVVDDVVVTLNPQIIISSTIEEPTPPFTFAPFIFTNYAFVDYTPAAATIYMKQLDASPDDGGIATGFEYTGAIDLNSNGFNQVLPIVAPFYYGWYEVQVIDADGLESNIEYVYFGDSNSSNPNPSIQVQPEILGQTIFVEHTRDINYRFNNFTPGAATLTVQAYNFVTGGYGPITSIVLVNLTADTDHTIANVVFPQASGWYLIKLVTDTITFSQTYLVL